MELRQLRYLLALADERHFTRAAARANVAQPALSRQIRRLEDELGVPLVDRTTRRVTLTPAGQDLVDRARCALAELDDARAVLKQAAGLLSGRLAIGVTQTPGPIDVPSVLARFHGRHPEIELSVHEDLSVSLAEQLRRDEIDVGIITNIPDAQRRQLQMRSLASERLMLIVDAEHRFARRATASVAELRDERLVMFPPGATIRALVEDAARDAGVTLRVAFETNAVARARALVAHGLGVGVMPESDVGLAGPAVAAIPLARPQLTHEVFLAWRAARNLAPAAAAFVGLAG